MRTRQLELNQATTVTVFEPHDTQFSGRDVWNIIFTKLSSPSLFLKKSAMAPKNQKGSSSNKQKPQEEEREDSLQAVVGSLPPGLERKTHINAHRFLQILTKRDSDLILSKSRGYVLTLDRSNGMLKNF